MSFVTAAMVLGGATIASGLLSSNAASSAASSQQASAQAAINQQNQMWQQNYGNLAPWMTQGQQAGGQLNYLMGLGPTSGSNLNTAMGSYGSLATPFSQTNWQADPGYAFRLQQGQQALERSAAARGMTLSGAQAKALTAYGQGMGSQEYMNAYNRYNTDQSNLYNRLAGISGTGLQAGSALAGVGTNVANQISNAQLGIGNAMSAGQIGSANAYTNMFNTLANQGSNAWNAYQNANPWTQATTAVPQGENLTTLGSPTADATGIYFTPKTVGG